MLTHTRIRTHRGAIEPNAVTEAPLETFTGASPAAMRTESVEFEWWGRTTIVRLAMAGAGQGGARSERVEPSPLDSYSDCRSTHSKRAAS